jgi:hypothetical protein
MPILSQLMFQKRGCVDVRTMSFDVVNVNDEVLRDG